MRIFVIFLFVLTLAACEPAYDAYYITDELLQEGREVCDKNDGLLFYHVNTWIPDRGRRGYTIEVTCNNGVKYLYITEINQPKVQK